MRRLSLLALALIAAACGAATSTPPSTGGGPSGTVVVYAAASLNRAFTELATGFDAKYPNAGLQFNFAGSQILVTQLAQGARADVLVTADTTTMTNARNGGLVKGTPAVFAHNLLEIAVAPGNPRHIQTLADLARSDVTLVLAAPAVPAGKYAGQALKAAGVTPHPKSLETDVESVLTKVELGEADAGIVYATDVKAAGGKVDGVGIPSAQNVVASYPVAELQSAPNGAGAAAFIEYLESAAGRDLLQRYGFQTA